MTLIRSRAAGNEVEVMEANGRKIRFIAAGTGRVAVTEGRVRMIRPLLIETRVIERGRRIMWILV